MRYVRVEGQQVEDAGQQIRATDETGDRFGVRRMDGEQRGGQCLTPPPDHSSPRVQHQSCRYAVEYHVGQMITRRSQSEGPEVEAERCDCDRSVRAVRVARRQRRSPEVVL